MNQYGAKCYFIDNKPNVLESKRLDTTTTTKNKKKRIVITTVVLEWNIWIALMSELWEFEGVLGSILCKFCNETSKVFLVLVEGNVVDLLSLWLESITGDERLFLKKSELVRWPHRWWLSRI